MATTGKIMNFYSDKEMTTAAFPRTKVDAVSDSDGTGLGAILDGKLSKVLTSDCYGEELPETGVEGQVYFKTPSEDESLESSILQAIYPINSIYTYGSNISPAEILGFGEWELVGKEFADWSVSYTLGDTGCPFVATENVTSGTLYIVRSGTSIRMKIDYVNAAEITDSGIQIGSFSSWRDIGITGLYFSYSQIVGGTDGGNAVVMYSLNTSNGLLTANDIVAKDGATSIGTDKNLSILINANIDMERMYDAACNRFHWKRTA